MSVIANMKKLWATKTSNTPPADATGPPVQETSGAVHSEEHQLLLHRFSSGLLGGRSLLGGGGLLGCRSLLRGRGLLRSRLLRGGRLLGRGLLGGRLGDTGGAVHRGGDGRLGLLRRSEENTSGLQYLSRITNAV